MKIGAREQIIILAVGLVLVLLALGAFLVWPQFQEMAKIDKKITVARGEVEASRALLQVREQSKARASETDAKWLRLGNLVPEGPDLPSLVIELQDAAFASGVQVAGIIPSSPTPDSATAVKYWTVPLEVDVLGTWSDTVDYMQRIQKLNRGLRIIDSITVVTDNTSQANRENSTLPVYAVQTAIKLNAYMIPAAAASSTPAAGVPTLVPGK